MSRLTASPFHKPTPFQFPRGLPSPPETNPDMFSAAVQLTSSLHANATQEFTTSDSLNSAAAASETPTSRLRKSSSIPYHSPSFRDNKDRSFQKVNKALIIVIPPSTLLQEHGRNAMLTSGPYHRLSQGIVMPLLPSMFAQVTAIAREFNFPSTTGICLYYQYTEDGLTLTPRISDDSWQTIWSHLSEPAGPNEKRPLISGKIEFDIDHRIARWYSAWISSIFREVSEMNHYPATAPSYGHARAESRTTLPDGRGFDEDDGSVIIQQSAPVTITRHIPRKLSLVERFETASVRAEFKAAPRSIGTPPEILPSASQAPVLSPIVQEEEPKTARQDLNSRVKSWRASAILTPTPLAATGQTSLEPVNLPNTMEAELQMEDYAWSVSSLGPLSYAEGSPLVSEYSHIPSVHLDSRLRGSVCSTPSIRTSFGPSDYDPFSPTFLAFDERVPSPDIAHRFFEDSPPTPLTATSWGPPLSYPPSPRCVSPVPSVDLGERSRFEDIASQHSVMSHSMWRASLARPTHEGTPIANWPHVWPYTAQKHVASAGGVRNTSSVWPHVWPYNCDQHRSAVPNTWPHVWPYNQSASSLHEPHRVATWQHVWPYNSTARLLPSVHQDMNGYPYNLQHIYAPTADCDQHAYPHNLTNLYPPTSTFLYAAATKVGYPHNLSNIYPPVTPNPAAIISSSRLGYPQNLYNLYGGGSKDPNAYPYNLTRLYDPLPLVPRPAEPQGYPHNLASIYPAVADAVVADNRRDAFWVGPLESYPYNLFQIYPPVYPQNLTNIYPTACAIQVAGFSLRVGAAVYPDNLLLIYPPVTRRETTLPQLSFSEYPHNLCNIYPPLVARSGEVVLKVQIGYPHHLKQLYPPVYPHNLANIYPSVHFVESGLRTTASFTLMEYPHNLASIYPIVNGGTLKSAHKTGQLGYPHNLRLIYPPTSRKLPNGYPHNLTTIYPVVRVAPAENSPKSGLLGYPHNLQQIYPPVTHSVMLGYPHNLANLYPTTIRRQKAALARGAAEFDGLLLGYPHNLSNIYPAKADRDRVFTAGIPSAGYPHNLAQIYALVYPHNLHSIYSPAYVAQALDAVTIKVDSITVSSTKDGYPFNLTHIYPPREAGLPVSAQQLFSHYPHNLLNIYPPLEYVQDGYPHNLANLYPPLLYSHSRSSSRGADSGYPYFNIYPSKMPLRFAHFCLHLCNPRGQYPYFEIYPSVERPITLTSTTEALSPVSPSAVATYVRYPTFNLYPTVYPHFDLYPPLTTVSAIKPEVPAPAASNSRLTHAELHAMVMMEKMGSLRMMQRAGSPSVATYSDDMNQRFVTNQMNTAGLERPDVYTRSSLSRTPSQLQEVRKQPMPASLMASRRPLLDAPSRVPSSSALPHSILRPAQNSIASNQLAPIVDAGILRSSSLRVSPIPKPDTSVPVKAAAARRRDSLVFQRIRAYDNNAESSTLSKETLAKFPMPPRMPLPPLPTDRRT